MSLSAASPHSFPVIQGERRIAQRCDVMLTTILGSCVAACLWDEFAEVGGMNHFLLPDRRTSGERDSLSGAVHAMELLINDLLKAGASRQRMQAKLFGGASLQQGLTRVGEENADFAERFLAAERIPLVGGSLRGQRGRRIQFWPMSGAARQIFLRPTDTVVEVRPAPPVASSGELELF